MAIFARPGQCPTPRLVLAPPGRAVIVLALALVLTGCSTPSSLTGRTADEVRKAWGEPAARHPAMPGPVPLDQRWEYPTGPMGRQTWMVDLDAQGRVRQVKQVLTEQGLQQIQSQGPTPVAVLRRQIGSPGQVQALGRGRGQVWSWRYETNDCLWFQMLVDDRDIASAGAFVPDPRCDAPSDARS